MQKQSLFKQKRLRWAVATLAVLAVIGAVAFATMGSGSANAAPASRSVTIWIQASDSCMEALPGAAFVINGPGMVNRLTATTPGTLPTGIPGYVHRQCPIPHGSCMLSTTGCIAVTLNVPAGGGTYTIAPRIVADPADRNYLPNDIVILTPKQYLGRGAYNRNYSYVKCEGGSDCPRGGEVATVHVSANGSVSATVQNIEPDGFRDAPWGTFTGAKNNPVMFHFYGASRPGDFSMVCNQAIRAGDTVARDPQENHMTGNPNWAHCRSGR